MKSRKQLFFCALLLIAASAYSQENKNSLRIEPDYTWKADLDHSFISFRTKHWGIVEIMGWFENFDVTLKKHGDIWETSEIKIVIDPKSVRMPNMEMAENLQKEELFDSENFPEIVFVSDSVERKSDSNYVVTGKLTIKKTTKKMKWDVIFNGAQHPPYGNPGFTATGNFLLSDFNIESTEISPANYKPLYGDSVNVRSSFRLNAHWD